MHTEALKHLRALPLPPTDAQAKVIEEAKAEERNIAAVPEEIDLNAVQRALACSVFLLKKHLPGHNWTPQIEKTLMGMKAARGAAGTEGLG